MQMWHQLSTNFVAIDQHWLLLMIVNQFTWTEISTHDESLNQVFPTQLTLNMSTPNHDCYFLTWEMTCTRLIPYVGCHRTLCWHLIYMFYMVSRSRRWQRPQQRISCNVNPESSICGADDQAESPLADSRPASHRKLCQPLQLRHPPGPDPIPSCSVHCANTFLSIIECEFIHTGDATQGDVRAVNTPIQLNSMHNSVNNTQTFW